MKKTLSLILAGLMLSAVLAACGGESDGTTTPDSSTEAPTTTTTKVPVTTTGAVEGVTTTADPAGSKDPVTDDGGSTENPDTTTTASGNTNTPEVTTTEDPGNTNTPEVPEKTPLSWVDNNGDLGVYYEITEGEDGAVNVSYTKQTAAEAEESWGYSWVNMAADISQVYTGQTKFVLKVQGTAGKSILVKPFDNQSFEKTVTFDGNEQTITFTLNNVPSTSARTIIIFGEGGAVDTSGEFTILDAYFE